MRPLGDFSSTHYGGAGIGYEPANHLFNLLKKKHIAFTCNGGLAYYIGKKKKASGYPYKYPGYFFLYAFGGVLYNPVRKFDFTLIAGPVLRICTIIQNLKLAVNRKEDISLKISLLFRQE